MKLSFATPFLTKLAAQRDMAAESVALAVEIKLAIDQGPVLFTAEQSERDAIEAFKPSELIEFTEAVQLAFTKLRRHELIRAAVSSSRARLESQQAKLQSELKHNMSVLIIDLRKNIRESLPQTTKENRVNTCHGLMSRECLAAFERVSGITGETVADKAFAFVALCIEFGAQLPEVAS